ncbi:hypothetical protein AC249_AIPGENE8656 [Exaiptasia diaphana]|nr:hypothetical protein AC249_AIPGENE8656 [Exaiptasia diaphana]
MNEEMPIYDVLWDDIPEEELTNALIEATEAAESTSRFAEIDDSHIDKILDNALRPSSLGGQPQLFVELKPLRKVKRTTKNHIKDFD